MLSILSLTNPKIEVSEDHALHGPLHGPALHDHLLHDNDDDDDVHDEMNDQDSSALSKAEIRKSNKPIMEKRRRARINTCLNELKSLILDALKKDPSRHSKLEKADILEMTVKHLQAVQRQQLALAVAHDPAVLGKFKGGFGECAQEITRYISRIDGVDAGVRQRLMQHLSHCTNSLNSTTPLSFTAMAGLPMSFSNAAPLHPPQPQLGDLSNNQARFLHRFVAARLAAAGDTTGAALVLNGGISLLGRGCPPPPHGQPQTPCPPPPPPHGPSHSPCPPPTLPQNPTSRPIKIINTGPSSSAEFTSVRVSAFTAVKRLTNPTEGDTNIHINKGPHQSKVLAPTALRPVLCSEGHSKTTVQAQVALKPMSLNVEDDAHSPIDFTFRRNSIIGKRPLEDPSSFQRPQKVAKIESVSSLPAAHPSNSHLQSSPPSTSRNLSPEAVPQRRDQLINRIEGREGSLNNSAEGDDKDMWRPW